jgi:uncharacterized protein YvpB
MVFLSLGFLLLVISACLWLRRSNAEQTGAFESIPTLVVTATVYETQSVTTPAVTPTTRTTPVAISTYKVPDSFYITSISGHRQAYSLGCEASSAVDWANYFGVSIIEYTFQVSLPHSDNPDYGFVGDVNSEWGQIPPYAYGVHSGPVADLLNEYGLPAKSVKGYTLDEVRMQLSQGKPIIAWVIGKMEWSAPESYIDSEGRTTTVAAYEHVVILTGYDVEADTIRFMSNGVFYDVPTQTFLTSWDVLGNMAVIYDGEVEK